MKIVSQKLYAKDGIWGTALYYILPNLHYHVLDSHGNVEFLVLHPQLDDAKLFRNEITLEELDAQDFRIATLSEEDKFRSLRDNDEEFACVSLEFLNKKAQELAIQRWGVNFKSSIKIHDKQDKTSKGYAYFDVYSNDIYFTEESLDKATKSELIDMLLHELCHWYLFIKGEEYKDSSVRFAKELIAQGVAHTHNSGNDEARKAYEQTMKLIVKRN